MYIRIPDSIASFRGNVTAGAGALMLLAAGALVSTSAIAQLHGGDIFPNVSNGRLVVTNGQLAGDGRKLFEGDFRDFALGPYATSNPGFDAEPGTFQPGMQLWFRGIGTLGFSNGGSWGIAPTGNSVRLTDALGNWTVFTGTGVSQPEGVIDQVVAGQELHQHLRFDQMPGPGSPIGAYLIAFELVSRSGNGSAPRPYTDSAPFYLVFNGGLSPDAFEQTVGTVGAVAQIPVPPAIALMLGGIALLGATGIRRRVLSA